MIRKFITKPVSVIIVTAYPLLILISFTVSGGLLYYALYGKIDRYLGDGLAGLAATVSTTIPGEWMALLRRRNRTYLERLELHRRQNGLQKIVVTDIDGNTVMSTDSTLVPGSRLHILESGILDRRAFTAGRAVCSPVFRGNDGRFYKSAIAPVSVAATGETAGYLYLEASARALEIFRTLGSAFLAVTVATVLVTLGISLALSRTITGPIGRLLNAVRQIDDGDLSVRVDLRMNNEFRRLAEHFNAMAASLEDKERRLRDKISSLEVLSGGIAHEIRNPLNGIGLFADLIADKTGTGSPATAYIGDLKREVRNLNAIVNDFLAYARSDRLVRTRHPLRTLAEEAVRDCLPPGGTARPRVGIDMDAGLVLYCDGPKIRRVLGNLVSNALQFASGPDGLVRVAADADGDTVRITVSDNGPGIPAENLEKVFDPFFTSRAEGTGLGLAIVRKVVSQHGGLAYAARVDGQDGPYTTCFTLYFPRKEGAV